MRYEGYTIDGSKLFEADTEQRAGDAAIDSLKRGERLAYVFDNEGGRYPYTTWKLGEFAIAGVGTPHSSFDEVVKEVRRA